MTFQNNRAVRFQVLTFVIIGWLLIGQSNAQTFHAKVDSLIRLAEKSPDKRKVLLYDTLSRMFWGRSADSSLLFAKQSMQYAEKTKDLYSLSVAYNSLGNAYIEVMEPNLAIENYKISKGYREKLNDKVGIANSIHNMSLAYMDLNMFSEALSLLKEGVSLCQEENDLTTEAFLLMSIANVYRKLNDSNNALENVIKATNIYLHLNNTQGLARTYTIMGHLHRDLKNFSLGLEYYKRAYSLFLQIDNEKMLASAVNNLGIMYDELKDYPKALEYFSHFLDFAIKNNDKEAISSAYNNIGFVKAKMKNYNEALESYFKSIEISKEIGNISSEMNTYNNIAWIYFNSNRIKEAEKYATLALSFIPEVQNLSYESETYEIMGKIRYSQGIYQEACKYTSKFMELKDSLFNVNKNEKFAEMQVRFETAQKEKEIELLKKNEEIQSLTILRQRNLIFLWIAIFILLVAVIGTIYYNLLSKKKVNALLSEKNEELKEANVKLLKSEENLKELNTAKDKFFSIIAHDLKNPFNTLLGISELLSANVHSYTKEEIQERSQIIHDSTLSLYKLLDNLLNWSRSQLDSIVYQPELFPLLPEVNQEIKLIETFSDRKNVKISVRIADHIMVFADKHVIGIVLRNLINNAVKFSHIDGKVMVSADEKGDMVEVAVTDNGVGMDREELDKLFKLDQSFTTKGTANETGTGLGLILCKEFIEKNGGKIWVSSTKEKGSTFFFTLRTDRWA